MMLRAVVNKTPSEAKSESPPYFCTYMQIVGADGMPETMKAINRTGNGMDNAAKGSNSKGKKRSRKRDDVHK
ncbi:hypothetical protein J22TS1_34290 [Siminovitchia terrae]|nr:hypothetical protein J22TS1_34290 [Siminovitchia terrae]